MPWQHKIIRDIVITDYLHGILSDCTWVGMLKEKYI